MKDLLYSTVPAAQEIAMLKRGRNLTPSNKKIILDTKVSLGTRGCSLVLPP